MNVGRCPQESANKRTSGERGKSVLPHFAQKCRMKGGAKRERISGGGGCS